MGRNPKKQKVEIFRYVPPPAPTPPTARPAEYVELHLPLSPVKKDSVYRSARSAPIVALPDSEGITPDLVAPPLDQDWDGDGIPDLVNEDDEESEFGDNDDDTDSGEEGESCPDKAKDRKRKRSTVGDNPFLHFIPKIWQGAFFEQTTLKELGLRVQLGHSADAIHSIHLDFCGCRQAVPRLRQLIRYRLFPATTVHPKSAATFRVLETYQMLSFTSRVSAYEFIKSIERRTDNTGTMLVPDRYTAWLRMIREWRHLRLLKRMGRGHDPSGVAGTLPGELAVLCPACPYPDVNLPPDYEQQPEADQ
ncbi:hypothetical protein MD484_g8984, partial [Candolleomyces efflorescens]